MSHVMCHVTLILPDLIREKAPTSSTGVFPVAFLSPMGPILGRGSPNLSVSPNVRLAMTSNNLSTNLKGNHLRRAMANANVEIPNMSLGKMCTYIIEIKQDNKITSRMLYFFSPW